MSTIGTNRLAIYNLLYNHPLCDYIKINSENDKELNVLIIGNGWVGNEAIKAVFWDGQYPDTKLNITIASANAGEYEKKLKEALPGLLDFADFNGSKISKYHYANIGIREVSFDEISNMGLTDDMLSDDCLSIAKQNYIIISVGDEEINCILAEMLAEKVDRKSKVLIASYGAEQATMPENIVHVPFLPDSDAVQKKYDTSELFRLATNINFVYESKYNGDTVNRKKTKSKFNKKYTSEFIGTPEDTDDMFTSIKNFTGGEYTADSSLAQAVHMPMKLDYCCRGGNRQTQLTELVKHINEQDEKFNELVALEHRRWCAYMAVRAYRMPKKDELGYLYKGGNTHKDDNEFLHICMCECGNNGTKLNGEWWKWKKDPEGLSQLDDVSRYCQSVLRGKLKYLQSQLENDLDNLRIQSLKSIDVDFKTAISEYIAAINKLIQDDSGALNVYAIALEKLKKTKHYGLVKKIVDSLDGTDEKAGKLKLAKERNKHIDFYSYDVQFINMIPLCLKLGDSKSTVVTFVNGQIASNVLAPMLLCSDEAVFVETRPGFPTKENENSVKSFFELHGGNTTVTFATLTDLKVESIKKELGFLLKSYENVIFNTVPGMNSDVLIAIGELANKFHIVSYDAYRGISFHNMDDILPSKVEDISLSVDDYLKLVQGEQKQNESVVLREQCRPLEQFFWRYSKVRERTTSKGEKKYYSVWNSAIIQNFLQKNKKPKNNRYTLPLQAPDLSYIKDFREKVLSFLDILEGNNIITYDSPKEGETTVSFYCKDNDFYNFISAKGGNLFETLVYDKIINTGMFKDVQTGVSFQWKSNRSEPIMNEIDVVATNGVNIVFVSCKTNPTIDNGFIYEIASEATSLGGIAALATSQDLSKPDNCNHNAVERAKAMGVALIDQHILRNESLLRKAITQILKGEYEGPEDFR